MKLEFSKKREIKVDMKDRIKELIKDYPLITNNRKVTRNDSLFKVDDKSQLLHSKETGIFHDFAIKGMFLVKRKKPDEELGAVFKRVISPMKQDAMKLSKTLEHLNSAIDYILNLEADNSANLC